jgi:endonuclease-8
MPIGEMARSACAMRTALVGHPVLHFDAPGLIGPTPRPGLIVELVEARGKHVEVTFDDGLVLDTQMKNKSEWHVYREGAPWRRSWDQLKASIQTEDFVAVCFSAASVETYRQADRDRHPGRGRLGPDLMSPTADLCNAVNLLLSQPDPETRVRDALIDQHVIRGLGNVYRCEVMWALELSPWAHVGDLNHDDAVAIIDIAVKMLQAHQARVRRAAVGQAGSPLSVYGRCGQICSRCHDSIQSLPVGQQGRMLYWCPGCQVRHDRRHVVTPDAMDPHPAATKYLSDLPWRHRHAG